MRLIALLILFSFTAYGQIESQQLQTTKYAGSFSYTKHKSATGTILIYPETDSTVLFYIDVNRGAPSYNMGSLYGRLKITKGLATYVSKDQGCQWTIQFTNDRLTIVTVKDFSDCRLGNGVVVDGSFGRTSMKVPDHFVDREGTKYFFKTMTPEKYYN
ncbi:MAG TPA: hypothetical protein VEW65_07545 [Chryseolinea sp.]|nr:hypothetical protein [Chryseolinea sp.]